MAEMLEASCMLKTAT